MEQAPKIENTSVLERIDGEIDRIFDLVEYLGAELDLEKEKIGKDSSAISKEVRTIKDALHNLREDLHSK